MPHFPPHFTPCDCLVRRQLRLPLCRRYFPVSLHRMRARQVHPLLCCPHHYPISQLASPSSLYHTTCEFEVHPLRGHPHHHRPPSGSRRCQLLCAPHPRPFRGALPLCSTVKPINVSLQCPNIEDAWVPEFVHLAARPVSPDSSCLCRTSWTVKKSISRLDKAITTIAGSWLNFLDLPPRSADTSVACRCIHGRVGHPDTSPLLTLRVRDR